MKYIITDPCYIVSEDVWDKACKHIDETGIDYPRFEEVLSAACGTKVDCCDTGYGDWDNSISGPSDHIISHNFCADAGLVCVAKLTPEIEKHLDEHYDIDLDEPNTMIAVIDVSDVNDVSWHGSDNWTKFYIETPEGRFESEDDPSFEDEDDDWEDEDEDEDDDEDDDWDDDEDDEE